MVSFNVGSSWASTSTSTSACSSTSSPIAQAQLPPDHPPVASTADACPVDHTARAKWLSASTDSPNPFHASSSSSSSSSRSSPLTDHREISSIPRGQSSSSDHLGSSEGSGSDTNPNWVYPSEKQFFNAMQRKNHSPKAKDMKSVVPIHNAVNEKAWEEILAWEAGMGSETCGGPRLISFSGRPKDRTPKAWMNLALGYTAPFDRHDWLIDRCGTHVRYVIDFYAGKSDPSNPKNVSFYLDVRPAVDSVVGVETRAKGWLRQWTGIVS